MCWYRSERKFPFWRFSSMSLLSWNSLLYCNLLHLPANMGTVFYRSPTMLRIRTQICVLKIFIVFSPGIFSIFSNLFFNLFSNLLSSSSSISSLCSLMAKNQGTHVPYIYLRVFFYLLKYISYCSNLHVIACINPALLKKYRLCLGDKKKRTDFYVLIS